ncbi:MAG TPA: hypothetical protein VG322_17990 [Candidatus Acidoferrales bacterium]|nr:hypothetical protein [Candidatus Acidoferrales bacterium]
MKTRYLPLFVLIGAICVVGGSRMVGAQGESPSQPAASGSLDYEYFKDKVEPIFLKKRPGHARCVSCHSTNNVRLHLVPLSPGATTWDDVQSRENFELVKRVAFPGNLESPLLIHPLAESAGGDFFHSGGKHFNSQNDPEWLTLKAFVMGQTDKQGQ